ncbi:hypothetical protein [Sphingomonas radiodurans]|uniref:hypothetical protein n=1 Tax=Sphingomonas radiodurans TaxID=2890321 RepID=UPI001E50E6EB|nr:hypothetical protein [Sphingomonas radiodurans]WBH17034.1 hypothetical protein LLW23_02630 [Sphingomonas radiodurans]
MRQVNRDEFAWSVAAALRKVSTTLRKHLATGTAEQQDKARATIALHIADDLKRYEILTDAPEHLMGDEAYSRPLRNMLGDSRA